MAARGPDSSDASDVLKQLSADNPKVVAALGGTSLQTLVAKGMKFMAVDPSHLSPGVSVTVVSAPGAPSQPSDADLEGLYSDGRVTWQQAGIKLQSHRLLTINGRRVLQVVVDITFQAGGATLTGHQTIDAFVAEDRACTLVLQGTNLANVPALDEIANSFHFS
jgi:hypothetical protein